MTILDSRATEFDYLNKENTKMNDRDIELYIYRTEGKYFNFQEISKEQSISLNNTYRGISNKLKLLSKRLTRININNILKGESNLFYILTLSKLICYKHRGKIDKIEEKDIFGMSLYVSKCIDEFVEAEKDVELNYNMLNIFTSSECMLIESNKQWSDILINSYRVLVDNNLIVNPIICKYTEILRKHKIFVKREFGKVRSKSNKIKLKNSDLTFKTNYGILLYSDIYLQSLLSELQDLKSDTEDISIFGVCYKVPKDSARDTLHLIKELINFDLSYKFSKEEHLCVLSYDNELLGLN